MSGHSKWANIRIRKGAQDKKRGKIFTRHSKLIEIAAREGGGGDLEMNPRLLTAIDNAKTDSVPNANIERAIKKGAGELKGEATAEVIYEAYLPLRSGEAAEGSAPSSIACIIECLSDNKNRTLNNVRSAIEKNGGKWAASGSVKFLFAQKGVVTGKGTIHDDLELALIDAGAEEIDRDGDTVSVTTGMAHWTKVRDLLRVKGIDVSEAGLRYVPMQQVPVTDLESAKALMEFLEVIEEDEDVAEVHTNADIAEEIAARL